MLDAKTSKDLDWLYSVTNPVVFTKFDGSAYKERVPAALTAIWECHGLASWADGGYQNIDPQSYIELVQQGLANNSSLKNRPLVPFILTAFGQILGWDPDFGVINFDLQSGRAVIERDPESTKARKPGNIEISLGFSTHEPNQYNYGLYSKARKKFGKLEKDEMYYFESALSLGGERSIKNVSRGSAQVRWELLKNISEMETYFYKGRYPNVELVKY